MGRGLGEDQGENSRGEDNGHTNGDSHEAPLLSPPLPPPPSMTHAEMMAERLLVASPMEAPVVMAGMGVVPTVLRGPIPIRTYWGHTRPCSC